MTAMGFAAGAQRAYTRAIVTQVALVIVLLFAVWIAALAAFAVVRPAPARAAIARFATGWRINLAEQGWRAAFATGMILRAPDARTPDLFAVCGWIILATAIVLVVLPLRWHAGYARWWSRNLPLWAMRTAGSAGIVLAAALAWSAWG